MEEEPKTESTQKEFDEFLRDYHKLQEDMWTQEEFIIKVPRIYLRALDRAYLHKDEVDPPGKKQPLAKYKEAIAKYTDKERNEFFIGLAVKEVARKQAEKEFAARLNRTVV